MISKNSRVLLSIVVVFICLSAAAQKSVTGQEAINSNCSNDTVDAPNATSVNIRCTGLTPEQQKILKNIPDILNKLLSSQQSDTYQILGKLNRCVDEAAYARRSAAAAIRGTTTIYSYDGGTIRRITHENGSTQESSAYLGAAPEFVQMKSLASMQKWQELINLCETTIKAKPDWLTPYLMEAVAYFNLQQNEKAIPLLRHVRDESGGNSDYAQADQLLRQIGSY